MVCFSIFGFFWSSAVKMKRKRGWEGNKINKQSVKQSAIPDPPPPNKQFNADLKFYLCWKNNNNHVTFGKLRTYKFTRGRRTAMMLKQTEMGSECPGKYCSWCEFNEFESLTWLILQIGFRTHRESDYFKSHWHFSFCIITV